MKMMTRSIIGHALVPAVFILSFAVMAPNGPANALPAQAEPANAAKAGPSLLIDRLADCLNQSADAQRLACFDRTAGALIEARRKKDIVVLDRIQVRKAKSSLFGFSLPSIKLFGGGDDEQIKQLVGRMANSIMLPSGLIRFELEDVSLGGAVATAGDSKSVWETSEQVMLPPRRGDTVTIKSGALGSYVATAPGRRSARVRRIR
jgi:hypothetical protein